MTDLDLAEAAPADTEEPPASASTPRPGLSDILEGGSLLVAFLVWARVVTAGSGGVDRGVLWIGLAVTIVAVVLNRPWRVLPAWMLWAAAAVPLGALIVSATAPTGWAGLRDFAIYAYGAAMFVAVAAFARTPGRLAVAVVATMLVGFDQFGAGWLAWWGRGDAAHPFYGTFNWYNQTGAFLAPAMVLAAAAAVSGQRAFRLAGWAAGPFLACGVVFSTSRASMAAGVLGLAVVGACALRGPGRKAVALRLGGFVLASVALSFALTGPPVFVDRTNPFAGVEQRAAEGETTNTSTVYRIYFMKAAAGQFADRPLVGGGFGSFGQASPRHMPYKFTTLSQFAHNSVLQAFSDGGLVLGLPVLFGTLGILFASALAALRASRLADPAAWAACGAAGACVASVAHAVVDYDWSRPAVLAMTAVTGALAVAAARLFHPAPTASPESDAVPGRRPGGTSRRGVAAFAVFLALLAAAVPAGIRADDSAERIAQVKFSDDPAASAVILRAGAGRPFTDPRFDAFIVRLGADGATGPNGIPDQTLRDALAGGSPRISRVDPTQGMAEALVRVHLGLDDEAVEQARKIADSPDGYHRLSLVGSYGTVLYRAGRDQQARQVLTTRLRAILAENYPRTGAESLLLPLIENEGVTSPTVRCAYRMYLDAYPDAVDVPVPAGLVPAKRGCRLG